MLQFVLFAVITSLAIYGQLPSESKLHLDRAVQFQNRSEFHHAALEYKLAIEAAKNSNSADFLHALDLAASFYQDTGQISQAESTLRRLLAAYQSLLGAEHITINRIINRLACLYIEIGQRAKAQRLRPAEWLARLEAEAPLSDDRVNLSGTLAALETIRGNPTRAAELNNTAWQILERRSDSISTSGIVVLNNLAISYSELKRPKEAIAALERALQIAVKLGEADTLPLAATHTNLARAYERIELYPAAANHMAKALAIVERRCGMDSTRTAAVLSSYVPILRHLGRKPEARAAELRARQIGEDAGVSGLAAHSVDIADLIRPQRTR